MKNHTPHSPGMTPTAHERMEWERMGEAAFKLSRAHTANKFWLASKFTGDIPIDIFDKLQSEYRNWINYGFEPDIDAIKTNEINVLVKENRQLLAERNELREAARLLVEWYDDNTGGCSQKLVSGIDQARAALNNSKD